MIKEFTLTLRNNRRELKRSFRTNISRPLKDKIENDISIMRYKFLYLSRMIFKKSNLRFFAFILIWLWLFRDFAFATEPAATPEVKSMASTSDVLNFFIEVLTFLMTPLIMLAWWLLSPDWTFGEVFNLRPVFHKLWIYASNVVYIIFAFVLVYVAIVNIFHENKKTFELKTALPRLIVSILIVPFSWFIVSWTLSVVNILTASIIRLPIETINSMSSWNSFMNSKIIPKNITLDKNQGTKDWNSTNTWDKVTSMWDTKLTTTDCKWWEWDCWSINDVINSSKWWAYNILTVYAYWIFRIDDYQKISSSEKSSIKTILDLASKWAFWVVFFLAFWFMLVAIIVVLFTRAFKLWVVAIFSPFFALAYFFKDWKMGKKLDESALSFKSFASLAFVPVYVSAALAFWLMFIAATMSISPYSTWNEIKTDVVTIKSSWDSKQTQEFTFWEWNWAVSFKVLWTFSNQEKWTWDNALNISKWILGTIIIDFLALWVLWMAVKAALSADDITKKAFAPFEKMWDSFIKDAPKYAPIPMLPWWSLAWTQKIMWEISNMPERIAWEKANNSAIMKSLWKYTWNIKDKSDLDAILAKWNISTQDDLAASQKALKNIAQRSWTWSQEFQEYYKKFESRLDENFRKTMWVDWKWSWLKDWILTAWGMSVLDKNLTDKTPYLNTDSKVVNASKMKNPSGSDVSSGTVWSDSDTKSSWSWKMWTEWAYAWDNKTINVKVDSNTTVRVKDDKKWFVDNNDYNILLNHLNTDVGKWNMTEADFKKWLKDINMVDGNDVLSKLDSLWLDSRNFFKTATASSTPTPPPTSSTPTPPRP